MLFVFCFVVVVLWLLLLLLFCCCCFVAVVVVVVLLGFFLHEEIVFVCVQPVTNTRLSLSLCLSLGFQSEARYQQHAQEMSPMIN